MLQLELNLWEQLREAEVAPTLVDFRQLCLSFDAELNQMSAKEKMEQGAEAIAQLASLLAMRAEAYYDEFQQKYDPCGPSFDGDDFSDLVKQSFYLDTDELMLEREPTYRLPNKEDSNNSLVSEISKDDLLELLEESEVKPAQLEIEKLQYDEDVSAWIALVRSWLESIGGGQAELMQVIEGTAMEPIKVWMALLLGGFCLEKQGDFYTGDLWVS